MLLREENKSAEEWMGHLRIKVNVCEQKRERDRRLKEQFIVIIIIGDLL